MAIKLPDIDNYETAMNRIVYWMMYFDGCYWLIIECLDVYLLM
jgi:hypothetical protein